jgi:hypothetical protein
MTTEQTLRDMEKRCKRAELALAELGDEDSTWPQADRFDHWLKMFQASDMIEARVGAVYALPNVDSGYSPDAFLFLLALCSDDTYMEHRRAVGCKPRVIRQLKECGCRILQTKAWHVLQTKVSLAGVKGFSVDRLETGHSLYRGQTHFFSIALLDLYTELGFKYHRQDHHGHERMAGLAKKIKEDLRQWLSRYYNFMEATDLNQLELNKYLETVLLPHLFHAVFAWQMQDQLTPHLSGDAERRYLFEWIFDGEEEFPGGHLALPKSVTDYCTSEDYSGDVLERALHLQACIAARPLYLVRRSAELFLNLQAAEEEADEVRMTQDIADHLSNTGSLQKKAGGLRMALERVKTELSWFGYNND